MMKHEEMITLIGNMFINAYVAGDRKDLDSFRSARADRDHLFDEIKELYAELEHESYERERLQVELMRANKEIINLREQIRKLQVEIQRLHEERYVMADKTALDNLFKDSTPEDLKEAFAKYATIPDDAGKFSEQDLPFPDVEEMAPAEEVEGSEE